MPFREINHQFNYQLETTTCYFLLFYILHTHCIICYLYMRCRTPSCIQVAIKLNSPQGTLPQTMSCFIGLYLGKSLFQNRDYLSTYVPFTSIYISFPGHRSVWKSGGQKVSACASTFLPKYGALRAPFFQRPCPCC